MASFFYRAALRRMIETPGLWEPSGYREERVRDWRFLWLRRRTVRVPYWDDVSVKLHVGE